MVDTILEVITAIAFVVYYFITDLNFFLVLVSLLILVFLQKKPPFTVFGHKPPVVININNSLQAEVKKYQKLAAIRWSLILVMVCLPLMGEDLFVDVTTVLISICLVAYGYKAGFLLRLDGMTELGFAIKNNVMEVHLQDPASTFRKKTYTELSLLIDTCKLHGINKVTMKSPMFYKKGSLREMDRLAKIVGKKGWLTSHDAIQISSITLLLASFVLFFTPKARRKINPFVWHCITLDKSVQ